MSGKRIIYVACQSLFAIGVISRFVLDRYWRSVSPHVIDVVTGHTYALSGRGGTVFVTPLEGYVLETLSILPVVFLVFGMLTWAQAWSEWK